MTTTNTQQLAGVTFRKIGKLHFYAVPSDLSAEIVVGAHVVAGTETGPELGEVKILRDVENNAAAGSGAGLLRLATSEDHATLALRAAQARDGLARCQACADALFLPLKVVDAEVAFDGAQATFYFVADTRIDFRQLVKDLAGQLRMRVLLHQVGSRDHAKALGGYGPCGRPLCCTTFLRDFAPVSMKMAKDQSLFLNPSKFSGVCGKLMCCLRYEHDVYLEAKDRMPPVGVSVTTPNGERGVITDVNIFKETATVLIRTDEETRSVTLPASSVTVARACGDCGAAGGGCGSGGACGSENGGCASAKVEAKPITLARWRRNWQ